MHAVHGDATVTRRRSAGSTVDARNTTVNHAAGDVTISRDGNTVVMPGAVFDLLFEEWDDTQDVANDGADSAEDEDITAPKVKR